MLARRLLEIVIYDKRCRIGGTLTLDDLAETSEIGDWKMPDFRIACSYAASQGGLVVEGDVLTLTTAGLGAVGSEMSEPDRCEQVAPSHIEPGRSSCRRVRKQAVRTGRNPATGEMIKIGEVIKIKAS